MSRVDTDLSDPKINFPKAEPKFGRLDLDNNQSNDLSRKTARAGLFSMLGQVANLVLRMGSMVIIARLVTPEHFGLVGMVTVFTGFLGLFRDVGLSNATVQQSFITPEQTSTLFWINLAVGGLLAVLCVAMAPVLSAIYQEESLFWITVAMSPGFLFNGASAQHQALLQRRMEFGLLNLVEMIALVFSIVATIVAAMAGMGYWALVILTISQPIKTIGVWIAAGWVPGLPRRGCGVRLMVRYGSVITLNSFVLYLAYNVEKFLLGLFGGAQVLGLYGRAQQLINLPSDNFNFVFSSVMFPALSRVQGDPERHKKYFLKSYSFFLALVLPVTVACGLFADDIVLVLLGPQWISAVPTFQFLTPAVLASALINPTGWLMHSNGQVNRSLKISCLIAPVAIIGYALGLPYGAKGVALGFSSAMLLLIVPVLRWATHDTLITMKDILQSGLHPLIAILAGGTAGLAVDWLMQDVNPALLRLTVVSTAFFGAYALVLLFWLGQLQSYLDLLRTGMLRDKSSPSV